MPDSNSIYFLNKRDTEAIVYTNAVGKLVRITRSDFDSEEEFLYWKSLSDEDFHAEEKLDHIYDDNNTSLNAQPEHIAQFPSAETVIESRITNQEREKNAEALVQKIRSLLTEKQFRRAWLYFVEGMTQEQIASIEGIGQRCVSKSIAAFVKKLKTFSEVEENRV